MSHLFDFPRSSSPENHLLPRPTPWDFDDNHIAINVNSIASNVTVMRGSDIKNKSIGSAWIRYNSTSGKLSVFLTYGDDRYDETPSLSHHLNLREVLPERVIIGFSTSTGGLWKLHQIVFWDFSSSFGDRQEAPSKKKRKSLLLVAAMVVGVVGLMVACIGYFLFIKKKTCDKRGKEDDLVFMHQWKINWLKDPDSGGSLTKN